MNINAAILITAVTICYLATIAGICEVERLKMKAAIHKSKATNEGAD